LRCTTLREGTGGHQSSTVIYGVMECFITSNYSLAEGRLNVKIILLVETGSTYIKGPHRDRLVLRTASDTLDASHLLYEHLSRRFPMPVASPLQNLPSLFLGCRSIGQES